MDCSSQNNELLPARILQVVTIMNRAGLETMLMNYYRSIDKSQIQFDFLVQREEKGDYDDEILAMGGRIFYVPPITRGIGKYVKALDDFFSEHKEYRIVHSHIDALSCFPLRASKKAGVPVRIAHSHNNSFDKDLKLPIRLVCKTQIKKYATDLFACSRAAAKFMFNAEGDSFHCLNNAIDTSKFKFSKQIRDEKRKELELSDKFVIGHIGRFHYQKNHEFLIEIFKKVYELNNNAVLVLVGNGSGREKIEAEVTSLGLENAVKFLGVRSDIPELMQAMDVFLLPSRFEGLGIVLVEAQAAGLQCFTSANVVTNESNITGAVHYISLDKPPEIWAEIILNYSENYERKDTIRQIIDAGYDIEKAAKWLEEFYSSKLNEGVS